MSYIPLNAPSYAATRECDLSTRLLDGVPAAGTSEYTGGPWAADIAEHTSSVWLLISSRMRLSISLIFLRPCGINSSPC